jgi:hypothetical protein
MDKNDVWQALHVFRRVSSDKGPARITRSCELKSHATAVGYAEELCRQRRRRGFQGRDPELAQIRGEPERLADGEEPGIIVEGAAGMGKSRLLADVGALARSLGIDVGAGAADPDDGSLARTIVRVRLDDEGPSSGPILAGTSSLYAGFGA